jgi:hypothetical protein
VTLKKQLNVLNAWREHNTNEEGVMKGRRSAAIMCAVVVLAFFGIVAYAVNVTPPEPNIRASRGELLGPSGPVVPNPGDTIKYDDGSPYWLVYYENVDIIWATRFTPAMDCTVKEAHCALEVWTGTGTLCSLMVFDNNAGEPGARVFETSFRASSGWNIIDITSPVTYPESTDFWIGYWLEAPPDPGPDTTFSYEDNGLNYGTRSYFNYMGTWYSFASQALPGDLCVRAYVEYVSAANRDVGPDSITSPSGSVIPDSTYSVIAWVHNYGDTNEVFGVECTITPGGYIDTSLVLGLVPGGNTIVAFTDWVVPPDDSTTYDMCVTTLLSGDMNPANDTLCVSIDAVAPDIHDVGVDSIISPPDTVEAGMGYMPGAWFTNHGNRTEVFQVFCEIDSGGFTVFSDTEAVFNLDPGNATQVAFGTWSVPPEGGVAYNTCIWSAVPSDMNPSNDTLCKSSMSVTGVNEGATVTRPLELALRQSTPNPFSGATALAYEIPAAGRVTISIYDATGSLVRTLVDAAMTPGYYSETWEGKDEGGRLAPEGVYFCRLSLGDMTSATKLVLVR